MSISLSDISESVNSSSFTQPESTAPHLHSAPSWTESEPEMIFSTTVLNDGTRAVVVLTGELDMATVGEFEQALSAVTRPHTPLLSAASWIVMIVTLVANLFIAWFEGREGRRLGLRGADVPRVGHRRSDVACEDARHRRGG